MLFQWKKVPLLAMVCGLCLSPLAGANEQAEVEIFSVEVPQAVTVRALDDMPGVTSSVVTQEEAGGLPLPPTLTQPMAQPSAAALAEPPSPVVVPAHKRVALVLPLRSATLNRAAEAVRAGFVAAWERERQGIEVTLVGTGDDAQDVLAGYRNAAATHDIVVGPLTRTGVTAVARSGEVMRPTIALTTPDFADGMATRLPPLMLAMGLSVEEEARQAAEWARRNHASATAYVVHTPIAWQRRAARAFAAHWEASGMAVRMVELELIEGYLDPNALLKLRTRLSDASNVFMFAALDANLARQLRESVGRQVPLYGTSQLNPIALPDRANVEPLNELEGAYLLDIPWQLQEDHPAVMAYPRLPVAAEQRRIADVERLYALGIDAYRVARQIAAEHTLFELDGVTGRLEVRFDRFGPHFERRAQQAVYRGGLVEPVSAQR